jgi:hypothetical protein
MIAFKDTDYTLYFDDMDLAQLKDDWEIVFPQLQNHTSRETSKFSLKAKSQLQLLSQNRPGMLVYQNEALLAVVHLSEKEPTEHIFYFEKEWFIEMIQKVKNRGTAIYIRWNGSGDKIFFLAGNEREAQSFKILYGPLNE